MSDAEYVVHARRKLCSTRALMEAETAKSDKWWRLRKQYIAQEVRLRNRILCK